MFKWGIMGPGNISSTFTKAVQSADDMVIAAVASRNMERALSFAKDHNIPKAYSSYEELAADPDIDAVYIGARNHMQL